MAIHIVWHGLFTCTIIPLTEQLEAFVKSTILPTDEADSIIVVVSFLDAHNISRLGLSCFSSSNDCKIRLKHKATIESSITYGIVLNMEWRGDKIKIMAYYIENLT